jgi:hypothetical protein
MREEELRKILLVKAVEQADREGTLLPPADRAAAGREAARAAGAGAAPAKLLSARAAALLDRIVARHPFVGRVVDVLGPTPAITVALVIAGLAIGAALPVLDGSQRINVLAFPLLGIVAWNLLAFALLGLAAARGGAMPGSTLRAAIAAAGSWIAARTIARARTFDATLAGALEAFAREWYAATRPLLMARAARALHLAAAAVGVGLVASLYVRGLAFDYRAGWESTFLDARGARTLLAILYGPASWLTGIAVPDAAALEAARWGPGGAGGEPAARWIHLIAGTAFLYVIAPRLALALFAAVDAARLALRAPEPAGLQGYFRGAFSAVDGVVERATAVVMPFACELGPAALAKLIAWIPGVAGGPVEVEARESVPYGEEERFVASLEERGARRADLVVLPFSLATTPEPENHGTVIAAVRDRLAALRPGARVIVVVDEAPYAQRMASAPERVAERREAWRSFVRAHGLEASFVSLA